MSLNLSSLAVKEETAEIQLRHPATGELLWADDAQTQPVSVTVYGPASKQRRQSLTEFQNRAMQRSVKKVQLSAGQLLDESNALLAAMTVSFNNLDIEGFVPASEDDFKKVYAKPEYSWLKDQVNEGSGDLSNFMGK